MVGVRREQSELFISRLPYLIRKRVVARPEAVIRVGCEPHRSSLSRLLTCLDNCIGLEREHSPAELFESVGLSPEIGEHVLIVEALFPAAPPTALYHVLD
jgi:hypothetical protein